MPRIEIRNLSVRFPIYHGNSRSLKQTLFAAASGRINRDAGRRVVIEALRDLSFSLERGERLGLVGDNGAGKTTLLRALAGIYEPVHGSVRIEGSLNALLDPGFGMNPELTGRENVMLRGLQSGLSKPAQLRLETDVRDFAELGDFMDLPVRFYSSGMVVRLGFALATAIRPQVLLMDEWFLAGDAGFLHKARARLETMVREAEILVLSSHIESVMRSWTTRVIWMENGTILADGPSGPILDRYLARHESGTARPVPRSA